MRRRLILSTTAVTLAVLIVVGVPLVLVVRRLAIAEATGVLRRQAEAIATGLADTIASGRAVTTDELLARIPPGDQLILETRSTRVVAGSQIQGRVLRADVRAVGGAHLQLQTSATPVEHRISSALLLLAVLGAAAVAGAAALAALEARRLARPLDDLATAARRLGAGDFSARAPRSGFEEMDTIAEALEASAHRIGDLVRAEREFSAHASHQLRSALTGLRLRLEALAASPHADVATEAAAALGQAERLSTTVDELLRLARTGRAADAAPVDLGALVAAHSAAVAPRLQAAGRTFRVDAPAGIVVEAAAGAIGQALDVLLDNAVRHGAGVVAVAVAPAAGSATISVTDHGGGIDPADRDRIFDGAPGPGGHGIGLRLARTLVEADGGRLELIDGHPPTFRITLPAPPPTPSPTVSP